MSGCTRSNFNSYLDMFAVRSGFIQFILDDYINIKVHKITNKEQSAVNHMFMFF